MGSKSFAFGGWLALWMMIAGCAGDGCACMTDLPDGFPAAERRTNLVQARVSESGLAFIRNNAGILVEQLFPDGVNFPVPPSCGSDPKVCCYVPHGYCSMDFDLQPRNGDLPRLNVTPLGGNRAQLTVRARLRTPVSMPVHTPGLFGEIQCYVTANSAWSGNAHVRIDSVLELAQDSITGTTRVKVGPASVNGLTGGDINIAGGLLCGFGSKDEAAGNINTQLAQRFPTAIREFLCKKCDTDSDCAPYGTCGSDGVCSLDDGSCMQSIGTQGRMDASAMLGALPTSGAGAIDLYLAGGGFASADNDGLSLGVLTGVLPSQSVNTHECVPEVAQPAHSPVAASSSISGNTHPVSGEPVDIAIGIHKQFLDRAAWAAHQAGFLCLDLGTSRIPLLTTSSVAILAPSMIDLTHGDDQPMYLIIRPQEPPTFALGKNTFSESSNGTREIDEPLFTIGMKDLEIDFYALIDGSYVRILTLVTDLAAPVGLDVSAGGNLLPVLGDIAEGFTNLRVKNSTLLGETPQEIADKFPAVLSVALPGLADELSEIEIPGFSGLSLSISPGDITAVDDNGLLLIAGDLAVASTTAMKLTVQTEAEIISHDPTAGAIEISLAGSSSTTDGSALEWQVRLDDGFWSPFTRSPRMWMERAALKLQGTHTLDVRARVLNQPGTTDPDAVRIEFLVDTMGPYIEAIARPGEVTVDARDFVSDKATLNVQYRIDNGAWLDAGAPPVSVSTTDGGDHIQVRVIDEHGNASTWSSPIVGFHGTGGAGSGCECRLGGDSEGAPTGLLVLLAVVVLGLRRRRPRALLVATTLAVSLLVGVGCNSDAGGDDPEPLDPTVVHAGPSGRWASMAAADGKVMLTAYEQTYGDLVVAEITSDGRPTFRVLDGAPAGPVVLDPDGYRGGVSENGADVGAWTSSALHAGELMVAYQDRDRRALRFGSEAGGIFTAHDVEIPTADGELDQVGLYNSLTLAADGTPSIAYVAVVEIPNEPDPETGDEVPPGMTVELRWATASSATPSSAADWTVEVITSATISEHPDLVDIQPGTGIYASAGRLSSGSPVVAYYDQTVGNLMLATRGDAGWSSMLVDGSSSSDRGHWSSLAIGTDDTVYVAYQNANQDTLMMRSITGDQLGTAEVVDDGSREGDRPHSVGAGARIVIDAGGEPLIAYQDGTTSELLCARRDANGAWERIELLTGEVGYGFYNAAARSGSSIWISTYAYDQSSWPPGHTEVVEFD